MLEIENIEKVEKVEKVGRIEKTEKVTRTEKVERAGEKEPRKRKAGDEFAATSKKRRRQSFDQVSIAGGTPFAHSFFERLAGGALSTETTQTNDGTDALLERDERFRLATCFKNAVCTITTNLKIDIKLFTNVFGGQLTDKLPANRLVIKIGNQRYTIITYASGKIILTNYFYLVNNSAVYVLFVNLIQLLYALGIGVLEGENKNDSFSKNDSDEEEREAPREISIWFLIENCIFSFQIAPHFFHRRFTQLYDTLTSKRPPKQSLCAESLEAFHAHLKATLDADHYKFSSRPDSKHDHFPSDLIKFEIERTDFKKLAEFKSPASRKRNSNNFVVQKLAILIFRNGKMIVTGMQTCEDLETTFKILFAIVDFFF